MSLTLQTCQIGRWRLESRIIVSHEYVRGYDNIGRVPYNLHVKLSHYFWWDFHAEAVSLSNQQQRHSSKTVLTL